jgi:hypothetical protein
MLNSSKLTFKYLRVFTLMLHIIFLGGLRLSKLISKVQPEETFCRHTFLMTFFKIFFSKIFQFFLYVLNWVSINI